MRVARTLIETQNSLGYRLCFNVIIKVNNSDGSVEDFSFLECRAVKIYFKIRLLNLIYDNYLRLIL